MKIRTIALAAALLAGTAATAAHAQDFSDKDKTFLKDSTEDNLAEIKMAEMTLRTTKNPAIRAFAEQMIKDHHALLAGAKPIADEGRRHAAHHDQRESRSGVSQIEGC